jgi:hypothetical protein
MSYVDSLPRVDLRDPRFDQQMMSALADWGIALFQGATGREDFIRKARSLVTVRPHRDSDPDGVTTIARRSPTNEPSMTGSPSVNSCRTPKARRCSARPAS